MNPMLLSCLVSLSLLHAHVATPHAGEGAPTLRYRWVYLSQNLLVDENVAQVEGIMKRAQAAGYNGVVLADYKLQVIDLLAGNLNHYLSNLGRVVKTARSFGLEIYPCLPGPGYASSILAHYADLAEGPPVKNALFVVRNGNAEFEADPPVNLANGDFENAHENHFAHWDFQDGPGQSSFADADVKHGGSQSVRMENFEKGNTAGNCRLVQTVKVSPWRQYHASCWIKSEGFSTSDEVRILALAPNGRDLAYSGIDVRPTQDWKQYDVVFNSLNNSELKVYFGVWGGKTGKLWWDDAKLEEVGLVNVVNPEQGAPVTVKSEEGKTYEENKDYLPVRDPKLGTVPWPGEYQIFHDAPPIYLTKTSGIHEGERLRVSFYAAKVIGANQVASSMSNPEYGKITLPQVLNLRDQIHPEGYFYSADEIRTAGWDELDSKLTPGGALAENVSTVHRVVKENDPKARFIVWSDMFDPYHNAVDTYYLANGSFRGSWKGLLPSDIVANWNYAERAKSLAWFQLLGNPQVLAGYYDGDPKTIRRWLDDAKGIANVVGVMYTTWQNKYEDLEAFARAAWGPH